MNFSRKEFIERCLAAGFITSCPSLFIPGTGISETELQDFIKRIGNTNNEKERVLLLEQVLNLDITSEEKEILRQILYIADRWANGFEKYAKPGTEGNESEGYLCGFFIKCSLEKSVLPRIPEDNNLFPLIAFYRCRMLVARLIQSGNVINVPDVRDKYLKESMRLMTYGQE